MATKIIKFIFTGNYLLRTIKLWFIFNVISIVLLGFIGLINVACNQIILHKHGTFILFDMCNTVFGKMPFIAILSIAGLLYGLGLGVIKYDRI